MAKFDAALSKKKFNAAVDALKKLGASQVRPKIKSIGPLRTDARLVTYATGAAFMMDEIWIASVVHSFTELAAIVTGNASLIYIDPVLLGDVPRSKAQAALAPGVSTVIQILLPLLLSTIKNKKKREQVADIYTEIHAAGVSGFGDTLCLEATGQGGE